MVRPRSRSESANIARYSSNDLPHGTTASRVNISLQAQETRRVDLRHRVDVLRREPFGAHGDQEVCEAVRRHGIALLSEIRRQDAVLRTDFTDGVRESIDPVGG